MNMKNEYETKIHNKKKQIYDKEPNKKMAKRLIQQYTPECIKCKRKVGTIFTKDENLYKAICTHEATAPFQVSALYYKVLKKTVYRSTNIHDALRA